MRRIHKHPLEVTDWQFIDTFENWTPLSVQVQNGVPCLWAEVDDEARPARWQVFVHGTGHEVNRAAAKFIGTFQLPSVGFVGHVYAESHGDVRALRDPS